jgi:hypothetical protein
VYVSVLTHSTRNSTNNRRYKITDTKDVQSEQAITKKKIDPPTSSYALSYGKDDVFDIILHDRKHCLKCVLNPNLNEFVQKSKIRQGSLITVCNNYPTKCCRKLISNFLFTPKVTQYQKRATEEGLNFFMINEVIINESAALTSSQLATVGESTEFTEKDKS